MALKYGRRPHAIPRLAADEYNSDHKNAQFGMPSKQNQLLQLPDLAAHLGLISPEFRVDWEQWRQRK